MRNGVKRNRAKGDALVGATHRGGEEEERLQHTLPPILQWSAVPPDLSPQRVQVRVRLQAELDVLVRDMQHVVLQHGGVVGLYPDVIVEVVLHLRFTSAPRLIFFHFFYVGYNLDKCVSAAAAMPKETGGGEGGVGRQPTHANTTYMFSKFRRRMSVLRASS